MNKEAEILFYQGKIEFLIQKCKEFQTDYIEEQEDLKEIINTLNVISISLDSWKNVDIDNNLAEKDKAINSINELYRDLKQELNFTEEL